MCKKCRDVIRERAITHFLNTRDIPTGDTRAAFEAGARFGELQAALFLEKATVENVEKTTVNPVVGLLAQLFQIDPISIKVPGPAYEIDPVDAVANKIMGELSAHFEQEGLTLLYGSPSKADADNYNSLRKVHELPPKSLAAAN